jgi:hypothetical protein
MRLKQSDLGPTERGMRKRFSVLLPPRTRKVVSEGSPSTGSVYHQDSGTVGVGLENLPSPLLDNFYTSDPFQWPLEMWTVYGDLDVRGQ